VDSPVILPETDPFSVNLVFLLLRGLFKLAKVFKNKDNLLIMRNFFLFNLFQFANFNAIL
jgi:hypothetical protein